MNVVIISGIALQFNIHDISTRTRRQEANIGSNSNNVIIMLRSNAQNDITAELLLQKDLKMIGTYRGKKTHPRVFQCKDSSTSSKY